jgi:hypothetical protein
VLYEYCAAELYFAPKIDCLLYGAPDGLSGINRLADPITTSIVGIGARAVLYSLE